MTTYYVRKTGNNAAAGTSPATAWQTISKALGAAGISSGDTVYIGAGHYREAISVAMISAVAETFVIGDFDGSHTGDAGEVLVSTWTTNDRTAPANSAVLNLAARDFLTFQNIIFVGSNINGNLILDATTSSTSTDIKFINCCFFQYSVNNTIQVTVGFGISANWLLDRCIIKKHGAGAGIQIVLTRGTGSDYDANITIKNCAIHGGNSGGPAINIGSTGAGVNLGGGVDIISCTSNGVIRTTDVNVSTTIPCTIYNTLFISDGIAAITAVPTGSVVEDYNYLLTSNSPARTNVTAGLHSIGDLTIMPHLEWGQSAMYGEPIRPFMSPYFEHGGLANFGSTGSSSYDLYNKPNPGGQIIELSKGIATAGGAKSLTDANQNWGIGAFAGYTVELISGTGSGQFKHISYSTGTSVIVDGNWAVPPVSGTAYLIYKGAPASMGIASTGTTTTMTDINAAWGTNQWQGYTLGLVSGTGAPQTLRVASNTATVLTFAAATSPDNTSHYQLYRGASPNSINRTVGAISAPQSGRKDTVTTRTGNNSLRFNGPGFYEFDLPVDNVSTTVTVWVQYNSRYAGTLPSMSVVNGVECGVTDNTTTALGSADAWEQLSLTLLPTAKGIVTIRLVSSCTTTDGGAYFEDLLVSP